MLAAGSTLGPYKILAPLGAGGMGEVYRAHDTRLGRDVAIKVLSPHLAATPEVRARFEREARTISQLNHPHICVLHDIGHQDGTDFLVMELLEGETLAHRLEKGALSVAEVFTLGTQIADALDRAHRAGVVHRDLKPGNVMLTKSGAKLMDFGLARAAGLAGAAPGALTESPTVSRPLTKEGTIVGTFQYMAPEQLEGKEADARSDLWALGCVLYEMATGKRAFEGEGQASLISAIMKDEPRPITELHPLTPPVLDHLVKRCLAKDAADRWQSACDVMHELQWIATAGSQAGAPASVAARRRSGKRIAWSLVAGFAIVAVVAVGLLVRHALESPRAVRFEVPAPPGASDMSWPRVSPDGRTLAFLAFDSSGTRRLWLRPLDGIDARALQGIPTLRTYYEDNRPFWSPDGRYLAYIAEGMLRKIPVSGGPVIDICDAPGGADGTWGTGGWILFDGGLGDSIRGVPASGGAPRPFTFLDRAHGEAQHSWPFFLPDGRHFLFVAERTSGMSEIRVGVLGSKETRLVGHTQYRAEYAPPGWLVYTASGRLVAQPFDARAGRTTGEPVAVGGNATVGADFSVSNGGALAYRPEASPIQPRLLWIARDGHALGEAAPAGNYEGLDLSPDGRRVAVSILGDQPPTRDIWVRDLVRGTSSRLTLDPGDEYCPIWSPDGTRIAYSVRSTTYLMIKSVDGTRVDSLSVGTIVTRLYDWSGPTNTILVGTMSGTNSDIWAVSADGRQPPRPILRTPFTEMAGRISPDGRWLAYASNESGRLEIYVVPYPGPGGRWQISTSGGNYPRWRADGNEIFFEALEGGMMSVDVHVGTTFEPGMPKRLFKATLAGFNGYAWAVSRDGQRFLMNTRAGESLPCRLVVATNWTTELGKR
jgi:eukaryotic-like serine/threonine-protein kinase